MKIGDETYWYSLSGNVYAVKVLAIGKDGKATIKYRHPNSNGISIDRVPMNQLDNDSIRIKSVPLTNIH